MILMVKSMGPSTSTYEFGKICKSNHLMNKNLFLIFLIYFSSVPFHKESMSPSNLDAISSAAAFISITIQVQLRHNRTEHRASVFHPELWKIGPPSVGRHATTALQKKKMTTWNTISPRCWLVAMWWHHFATFDDIILNDLHILDFE